MRGWFERMAWKLEQWMRGRNGQDNLAFFALCMGLFMIILTLLTGSLVFNLLSTVCWVYACFRMFSRNLSKRQAENTWFMNKTAGIRAKASQLVKELRQRKMRFDERKEFCFFKCKCGTVLRVRRGQGMKELVCPRCHEHMTRNTK